ncbi:putative protein S-acyltransferase 23 [Dorcoceras hygrometricum]|uniref:Uncharacterized protein n=1 Tax=Dorcoceras hygrometricum TaxID=472368 RepID=A0A2Z7A9H1_9LAMI|nr:putative protein S-acyltransferase 23 [Dorcoceras hygrometricum]
MRDTGPVELLLMYYELMDPCVDIMVKWQHRGVTYRDPDSRSGEPHRRIEHDEPLGSLGLNGAGDDPAEFTPNGGNSDFWFSGFQQISTSLVVFRVIPPLRAAGCKVCITSLSVLFGRELWLSQERVKRNKFLEGLMLDLFLFVLVGSRSMYADAVNDAIDIEKGLLNM